jgi:hypothetical protein
MTILVEQIKACGSLDESEVEQIQSVLKYEIFLKNLYLFESSRICDRLYFLVSGSLHLFETDHNEVKRIKQFAVDGWWITDFSAFHSKEPTKCKLLAFENSICLSISYEDYFKLIEHIPTVSNYFRKIYQDFFILCQDLFFAAVQNDGKGSYLYITEKYPALLQRIPLYQIASFLGVTPVLISNIRKQIFKKQD